MGDEFAVEHLHVLERPPVVLPDDRDTREQLVLDADGVFRVALALNLGIEVAILADAEGRAVGPDLVGLRYTYDNSATSPRNRNTIPRRVTFGQTSASEMGSLWLQVVPQTSAELATLDRDFSPKLLRDDIAGNEKWLEVEPKNAQLRAELAACYLEAERFEEGITQLREAVRLEPSAGRHYDLGRVLLYRQNYEPARAAFLAAFQRNPSFGEARYGLAVAEHGLGNLDAAIELYQRTIDTDAANVAAHYNLGRALATKGLHERAVMSYRRAIALAPEDADAHHALAQALAVQGLAAEAVYHYRRALEIEPDRQGALLDLAWILATTANPDIRVPVESVRLAERAAALGDGKNATVFDTLAAAYAAAGQTERAISNAERAVALATESGDPNLAAEIRVRLERYRLRR
jgi:tetratricopeptide (TPR) repeat protein